MILSEYKLTHGATVLLDYDEVLAEPFSLPAGSQSVQVVQLVRAAVKTRAEDGEQNVVRFAKLVEQTTVAGVGDALLLHCVNAPRAVATLTIEVRGGDTYLLADAAIRSWPATPTPAGAHVILGYEIIGGALTVAP